MKKAILHKLPYHTSFGLSLSNEALMKSFDKEIIYNLGVENINKEIKELKDFDYIVAWYDPILLEIDSLSTLEKPLILSSSDFPKRLMNNTFKTMVEYHKPKGIIVENKCTEEGFSNYLDREDLDFFWYPWGIDENYVKDYKQEKEYDVSQTGQFNRYEFRREINLLLQGNNDINYYRSAPNRSLEKDNQEILTYEDYCRLLNKSIVSIGGCYQNRDSLFYNNKLVALNFGKNMEIPGCGSALFNTLWGDYKDLGFIDEVNFVGFKNPRECVRKILYYMEDKEELRKITERGFDLVHKNHTNKIHVDNVIKDIESKYI